MIIKILIYITLFIVLILLAFHINNKIKNNENESTVSKTSLLTLLGIILATIVPYIINMYFYRTSSLPTLLYVITIPLILYFLKQWRILFGFIIAYIGYLVVVGIFFLLSITNFSL